jgi:hypothetical protein
MRSVITKSRCLLRVCGVRPAWAPIVGGPLEARFRHAGQLQTHPVVIGVLADGTTEQGAVEVGQRMGIRTVEDVGRQPDPVRAGSRSFHSGDVTGLAPAAAAECP